jgi:hypothetical protein
MRHLFSALTFVGLLGALAGCHHTCGKCDCDRDNDPCCFWPYLSGVTANGVTANGVTANGVTTNGTEAVGISSDKASKSMEKIAAPTDKVKEK